MRLDSHRLRNPTQQGDLLLTTIQKSCPERPAIMWKEIETSVEDIEMYTWRTVRRQHLRKLRKCTRAIFLFLSFAELLRCGVFNVVYNGKHGSRVLDGPEDYGIAHFGASIVGWLYLCIFAIIYVPTMSWWLPELMSSSDGTQPSDDGRSSKLENFGSTLQKINDILIPLCIGIALVEHIYYTISAFYHVDGRPIDPEVKSSRSLNTCRHWMMRLLLLGGVCSSIMIGQGLLDILKEFDLANVKPIEYWVVVLPVQINFGIVLGSVAQYRVERRCVAKHAAHRSSDAEAGDEKRNLLD